MSDEDGGRRHSTRIDITMSEGTPTTAKIWPIPTLEYDFKQRSREVKGAIWTSEDYQSFLTEHQDTVVVLFAIANELLTERRDQLFVQEVMAEWVKTDSDVEERQVLEEMSNKSIWELFRHYNLADPDVADCIQKTVSYRNGVVHDPQKRYRISDLDTLYEHVTTAQKAVRGIAEYVNNE